MTTNPVNRKYPETWQPIYFTVLALHLKKVWSPAKPFPFFTLQIKKSFSQIYADEDADKRRSCNLSAKICAFMGVHLREIFLNLKIP